MKWINVYKELPKWKEKSEIADFDSEHVLILESDGSMYVGYLAKYEICEYRKEELYAWREVSTSCGCCARDLKPTHWMELPKPPEKNEVE